MSPMIRASFKYSVIALLLLLSLNLPLSSGGEIYKWIDEDGTVHMTDNPASIPIQYRNQMVKKTLEAPIEPNVEAAPLKSSRNGYEENAVSTLKRVELPFQAFEGSARRIIIPVTFNNSVTVHLLLDTGAPGLVITPNLANRLGLINERDGNLRVMAGGIGGSVPAMLAIVDSVNVGDAHGEFLPATITDISSDEYEGLVGMDFMANYRISIDNNNHTIAFDELPPRFDRPGGHDETWWRSHFRSFLKLKEEWSEYLKEALTANLTSSETDKVLKTVKSQSNEADRIYRKLESYAREKEVPIAWRR
jgi:hypothetical protein